MLECSGWSQVLPFSNTLHQAVKDYRQVTRLESSQCLSVWHKAVKKINSDSSWRCPWKKQKTAWTATKECLWWWGGLWTAAGCKVSCQSYSKHDQNMVLGQSTRCGPAGEGGLAFQRCLPASATLWFFDSFGVILNYSNDVSEGITQQQEVTAEIQKKSAKLYYPSLVL